MFLLSSKLKDPQKGWTNELFLGLGFLENEKNILPFEFFSQFIPAYRHDKEKWFCNEISGEVLKIAGAKGINKDTNEYNPGSFQKIFN